MKFRKGVIAACIGFIILGMGAVGLVIWSGVTSTPSKLVPASPAGPEAERGANYFYGDAFGGLSATSLETHALPWRLSAAALVVAARKKDPTLPLSEATLDRELTTFGFLKPHRIGNWPQTVGPLPSSLPLGMTYGDLQVLPGMPVTVSNLGCAACHAGVTYDAHGAPNPDVAWLGLPNTSLNLEAYTSAIYSAYVETVGDPDTLLSAARTLFPDMTLRERLSLRYLVLPRVRARLADLKSTGRALPFPNGSPGTTNGVAALKLGLKVPMKGGGRGENGITSIPDLGLRTWRTSLLYDGAYAPTQLRQAAMSAAAITPEHKHALATIATFFSVPSMGVKPKAAPANIPKADAVFAFLSTYHAPRFPGPVNQLAAARGQAIYVRQCASCHGSYDTDLFAPKMVLFPNWLDKVGTDTERASAFTPELAKAVNATPYKKYMSVQATGGYVAPPLSGLWATAPYLHNGSVPSLAALLELTPRPQRFLVGGHRLNFDTVGIDITPDGQYPKGYMPWSKPEMFDTLQAGHANSGHRFGTGLSRANKEDLIAYLKRL